MPITHCRVCNNLLFDEPLLHYSNMPRAAQHLPTIETLANDYGDDLNVCQCSGCGLVQLDCEPVPYYREVIRASAFSPEMKDFRRQQFQQFVDKHSLRGKKIIEIGCGKGEYLQLMQECEIDGYGIEYGSESVEHCRANGLKVEKQYIEAATDKIKYAPFDAFFILNYLEHMPNITAVLRGIHSNLTDGGIGLIEVPNFDMMLENNLFSEFIADHLYYFTRETLINALNNAGLEIISCKHVWHQYIISAEVRKRPTMSLEKFSQAKCAVTTAINQYIAKFPHGQVAIWGAGHQALAVIAIADLKNKISFVVDSAPFKQGKFTPATHLPIVPPAYLNNNPPTAIIVMAAAYSDEVAKIIRRDFGQKIAIAILRENGIEELTF